MKKKVEYGFQEGTSSRRLPNYYYGIPPIYIFTVETVKSILQNFFVNGLGITL